MSTIQSFPRELQLATKDIAPEAVNAALAAFARTSLAEAIAAGEASPRYDRFVNNQAGRAEESVIAPGPILYVFSWWSEIIGFALEYLIARSPEHSGRFRKSWFVMANGSPVADLDAIPTDAEVVITNDQPYARKIEVGHMHMSVPAGVVEAALQAVKKTYGAAVTARKTFLLLPGGYVLRGHFHRGIGRYARRRLRPDTQAGQPVTYPALTLRLKEL